MQSFVSILNTNTVLICQEAMTCNEVVFEFEVQLVVPRT